MSWGRVKEGNISYSAKGSQDVNFTDLQSLFEDSSTNLSDLFANVNQSTGDVSIFRGTNNYSVEFRNYTSVNQKAEVLYQSGLTATVVQYAVQPVVTAGGGTATISTSTNYFYAAGFEKQDDTEYTGSEGYTLVVEGSNNGSTWTSLDTISNYTGTNGDPYLSQKYIYYRLSLSE
tara:strand:- start:6351 stop:6875 length:525 start_codon:yes stop_codon:yes gene_type:complete